MGTTLQNGVYLPNEGERNCYAGLKTNWEILDQKVADVTALQQAVAGALHREIVASLPTTDIDTATIYMILNGTSATENVYNEFMYVNNAWELIGTSATDLTNYYTKGDVDGLLVLKANASDLTSHTGDTTIHVTASDKAKWNTVALIKQLRLVNAQVGSATTIAFANIDDTNGIKVGDKCMDLDGRMFEITAVDTTNQTVTVGTALIDLALDGNVVHTSGDETVGGQKTFTNSIILQNSNTSGLARDYLSKSQVAVLGDAVSGDNTKYRFVDKNNNEICYIRQRKLTNSNTDMSFGVNNIDNDNNSISAEINFVIDRDNDPRISPSVTDSISLGRPIFRWKSIYSNSYYYGNVEFSNKFVTTDTAQTITEIKTFANTIKSQKEIEFTGSRLAYILPEFSAGYSGLSLCTYGSSGAVKIGAWKVDDNDNTKHILDTSLGFLNVTIGAVNSVNIVYLTPRNTTNSKLGDSTNKWKEINGLTPSSLSMPVAPSATSYVDISGYLTVLDSSSANTYTPPSNGYITFSVTGNLVQIFHDYGLQGKWTVQAGNANRGFIPVLGGVEVKIYLTASSVDKFWFIPCQGNI